MQQAPTMDCSASQSTIPPSGVTVLTSSASDTNNRVLTLSWTASAGTIEGTGRDVSWVAPQKEGAYLIYASASNEGGTSTCAVTVNVVRLVAATAAPPDNRVAMTQLPPLPDWTLDYLVPEQLVIKSSEETLGAIYDRLRTALSRAQISNDETAVYGVGSDGFAIVTHVEHIDDHGVPADPRWSIQPAQRIPTTLAELWSDLIHATPGRYRVIILVVTSRSLNSLKAPRTQATAQGMSTLLRQGEDTLPSELRQVQGTADRRCVAVVYEFQRTNDSEPKALESSDIGGPTHLAAAGLWPKGDLP